MKQVVDSLTTMLPVSRNASIKNDENASVQKLIKLLAIPNLDFAKTVRNQLYKIFNLHNKKDSATAATKPDIDDLCCICLIRRAEVAHGVVRKCLHTKTVCNEFTC